MADTYTAKTNLVLPANNDGAWDVLLNSNFSTIDAQAALGALAVRNFEDGASTSLKVKISAGTIRKSDGTVVSVSATSSLTLGANVTTSIWLTDAGAVTTGTSGFPAATNIVRLATVTTNSSVITSLIDARAYLVSYGAVAATGTVTSVQITVPAGLSVAGGAITTAGTLAITTALSGVLKGTGTGFTAATPGTDYLAGNQTVTLSGDVTGSGATAITTTIAAASVTLAKMANMATASFLGRNTAGTGAPEVLSEATAKTMLNLTGTNSGDQTIALTGDVTGSGTGSFAATVAKLQGRDVATTAPTDTYVLTWVASTSKWTPAAATGGGGSPGGSSTNIQVNASGAFQGTDRFKWDNTPQVLYVGDGTSGGVTQYLRAATGTSAIFYIKSGTRYIALEYNDTTKTLTFGESGSVLAINADAGKIGFLSASGTPVVQQSGDVATALVTYGLMSAAQYTGTTRICDGRLTLTTAVPVTTTDVTAAGTVYWTPYRGNGIALYNGSTWDLLTFAELSISLASGYTSGKNYDVFAYNNSGSVAVETLVWTNDTTRATALVLQNGVYCKTGALSRRYVGTFRTTSSTTTEDSDAKRFVFNYAQPAARRSYFADATAYSQADTSGSVIFYNSTATDYAQFLAGVAEQTIAPTVLGQVQPTSAHPAYIGLGLNQSSALDAVITTNTNGENLGCSATYMGFPQVGLNTVNLLVATASSGSAFFATGAVQTIIQA